MLRRIIMEFKSKQVVNILKYLPDCPPAWEDERWQNIFCTHRRDLAVRQIDLGIFAQGRKQQRETWFPKPNSAFPTSFQRWQLATMKPSGWSRSGITVTPPAFSGIGLRANACNKLRRFSSGPASRWHVQALFQASATELRDVPHRLLWASVWLFPTPAETTSYKSKRS
jgi:hypothetical protein